MTEKITSFRARGVFGVYDYHINFFEGERPATVIVGPNGTGKSTFINLYYFFISRQWDRLSALDFSDLEIRTDSGNTIAVSSSDLVMAEEKLNLPPSIARHYRRLLSTGAIYKIAKDTRMSNLEARRIAQENAVPESVVRELANVARHEPTLFHPRLIEIESKLADLEIGVVLYLPTFRRIERQLSFVGHDAETQLKKDGPTIFIELVKSGMQDVTAMIKEFIGDVNGESRRRVTRASQEFISEMVRGKIDEFSIRDLKDRDPAEIEHFIFSLDDELLSVDDKNRLLNFVEREKRRKKGKPKVADRYMGYFVSKMFSVFAETQKLESPIIEFISVIGRYLAPEKGVSYYSTDLLIESPNAVIKLDDLSSGEKQIVAVFAYLLLSGVDKFTVIIDEPELSLSVPWQKTFLEDIMGTERCIQLLAVTHSPFIFDNELESCVLDVQGLIQRVG